MELVNNDELLQNGNTIAIKRGFAKYSRKLIFWLIFTINLLNHLDHGSIAACTTNLMEELDLDHAQLGVVGSLVYLGLTLGAIIAGKVFNTYEPKWIVSISIIVSSFFLYYMTKCTSMLGLSLCRLGCGFFQVFSMIYFPVWVDQFGIYERRTIWLSFLQLGPALGTMIGYAVEAISVRKFESWKIGFYFQCVALIISICAFLFSPDKLFSRNYKRTNITRNLISQNINPTTTLYKQLGVINGDKYNSICDFSIYIINDEDEEKEKNFNIFITVAHLWNNKIYKYTLSGICCLLFIITGIEFWITNYMHIVLHQELEKVFFTFSIVCITAPTLGVLVGGYVIEKVGGYSNRNAIIICFYVSILSGCCGIPLPFLSNYKAFTGLMWFTLFFGGFIMPGLTGVLLFSIDSSTKEESNSVTHFCYNFFGYLPSPVLYGLVCNFTGGDNSRWGLVMLMCFTLVGMYFLKKAKDVETEKSSSEHILEDASSSSNSVNTKLTFNRGSTLLSQLYGKNYKNFE